MALEGMVLGLILSALVGGNNLSACVGTILGARIVSRKTALTIALAGALLGLMFEGDKLQHARLNLVPGFAEGFVTVAFAIVVLLFFVATLVRLPMSLSQSLAGTALGIGLVLGASVDLTYLSLLVGSWIITPFLAFFLSRAATHLFKTYTNNANIWTKQSLFRGGLILTSFSTSYVLGANTLGFIAALTPDLEGSILSPLLIVALGYVLGVLSFGRGVFRRVGEEIYEMDSSSSVSAQLGGATVIELFTQLGVPVSVTQAVSSGILGAGVAKRISMMNYRVAFLIVLEWVITPLVGLIAGFGVGYLVA